MKASLDFETALGYKEAAPLVNRRYHTKWQQADQHLLPTVLTETSPGSDEVRLDGKKPNSLGDRK